MSMRKRLCTCIPIFLIVFSFFFFSMNVPLHVAYAQTLENAVMITILDPNEKEPILKTTAVPYKKGETAFDLLKTLSEQKLIDFKYDIDPNYGASIINFNNVHKDETEYWNFVINGRAANVGISSYSLEHGDHLLFVLTDWTLWPPQEVQTVVSIIGPDKEIIADKEITLVPGSTAYDALKQVAIQQELKLDVSIDSEWLTFIQDIDDLLGEKEYWSFFINDEYMQVGLASYQMKPGDHLKVEAPHTESPSDNKNPSKTPGKKEGIQSPTGDITLESIKKAIENTKKYLIDTNSQDWYGILAFSALGYELPTQIIEESIEKVIESQGDFRTVTELEKHILILTAAGYDASNISGINLINKLTNHGRMENQGNNGPIYALLALDSAHYDVPHHALWNRESLIHNLLDAQLPSGGWSLFGEVASPDITGMALAALAPYKEQEDVASAIIKATNWLTSIQQEDGGFYDEFNGGVASESLSQVILGLTALNIDPAGADFTKREGNLITKILSFQRADGSFKHLESDNSANQFATNQAMLALSSYQKYLEGKDSIFTFSKGKPYVKQEAGKVLPKTAGNNHSYLLAGFFFTLLSLTWLTLSWKRKMTNG